ncbi:hypothetical protein MMC30_002682 [Trapelia coarctata]|nr:hypothetical protein [Trapelia coarctata]
MPNPPKPLLLGPLRPNVFKPPRGRKPIYLPNFTLTLLRTPFLPPSFASFITPLSLNKLDLKDYLYHAYNVPVLSIRSYIQQQRVLQDKPGARVPRARRWYRARSVKKMTVEMGRKEDGKGGIGGGEFVWPEEEEDLEPWDKRAWDAAQAAQKAENETFGPDAPTLPKGDRKTMAEQAKALLEGNIIWRPSWRDYGRAREVEVDVEMNEGGGQGGTAALSRRGNASTAQSS